MIRQIGVALLLAFVSLSGVAQESATPRTTIPLIASDSHHRPVSLTVESLVITDQKIPVAVTNLLRGADLPVELGVLIDASSSQRSPDFAEILKAAKEFVAQIIRGREDRVFLLQFAATPQATEWLTREQFQNATFKVSIGGETALYDALAMACKERMGPLDRQKPTRRIVVLISDGQDTLSHITGDEAASDALRAGTLIFTIDTGLSGISSRGGRIMQTLAEVTGGESFNQVGGKDAPKVFANIKAMIEGMYYLTYVPPNVSKSAVHEVEVKRSPKDKFKLSCARKYFWKQ